MAEFHYADVLVSPVVTEKSNDLMVEQGKYVFKVVPGSTKSDVKRAIVSRFGVKVKSVNIIRLPRKPKRVGMHRYKTSPRLKAIVTLHEGERIPELSEAV